MRTAHPASTNHPRLQYGLSVTGILLPALILAAVGLAAYHAYCYYELGRKRNQLEQTLGDIHGGTPAQKITRETLVRSIWQRMTAKGARFPSASSLRVRMEPLTERHLVLLPRDQLARLGPECGASQRTCTAEQVEKLNYTFVDVRASVDVRRGWLTRSYEIQARFYLPQPLEDVDPQEPSEELNHHDG